jgi:hypothetical protein
MIPILFILSVPSHRLAVLCTVAPSIQTGVVEKSFQLGVLIDREIIAWTARLPSRFSGVAHAPFPSSQSLRNAPFAPLTLQHVV